MDGLQRSEMSFRRQGSSGLVWDDKFLSGELRKISTSKDDQKQQQETKVDSKEAITSAYRAVNVEPAFDPPSPRVSGCGICGMFGKPASKSQKRKHGHRLVVHKGNILEDDPACLPGFMRC